MISLVYQSEYCSKAIDYGLYKAIDVRGILLDLGHAYGFVEEGSGYIEYVIDILRKSDLCKDQCYNDLREIEHIDSVLNDLLKQIDDLGDYIVSKFSEDELQDMFSEKFENRGYIVSIDTFDMEKIRKALIHIVSSLESSLNVLEYIWINTLKDISKKVPEISEFEEGLNTLALAYTPLSDLLDIVTIITDP